MHVVHTAGVPPNQGRILFPNISCTMKSKNADKKIVPKVIAVLTARTLVNLPDHGKP
ncbi:MAG: hypothetical protein ACJA16_000147 [Akkermansiaceae bacterium]|jgi:hypothetical protein